MLGWLREHVAPVASWTAAWTAFGALIGGAAFALTAALGVSTLGLTAVRLTLLAGLAFGVAGLLSALAYHGLALRGRPPRQLGAAATLLYGALAGLLPMATWVVDASRRGAPLAGGDTAVVGMAGLGAATALYLRWRDQRRFRVQQQLSDPTGPNLADSLRRRSTERAAT
jgi:predicted transporter